MKTTNNRTTGLPLRCFSWARLAASMLLLGGCGVVATETQPLARNNLRGLGDDELPRKDREPRIINGMGVDRLRYPYFSLMYGASLCGAVLIAPRMALGAAHCEDAADRLRIGAFEDVTDGQAINIRSTIVHPDYDLSRFDNDLIIFILEEEADYPHVQLEQERIDEGSFTVLGFGDTDKGTPMELPDELHEVELGYVDNDTCDDGHGDREEVLEDMMCAAGENKDSCIGDSGGPMIKKGNNTDEDRLVGVVSWGRGCAEDGVPGVYSRISYFYDWIVDTVCNEFPYEAPGYMRCTSTPLLDWFLVNREDLTTVPTVNPTEEPTRAPTKNPSEEPTGEPTKEPSPSVSPMPSTAPVIATDAPSINMTDAPTTERPQLLFVVWSPPFALEECQGDCDTDDDCLGDNVCYRRNSEPEPDTYEVPGCSSPKNIPNNVDICVNPAFLPT